MTTQISETAVARREASRDRASGRFGNDPAAESDLTLDDLDLDMEETEDEPEGFDHARISSLMGDAYHLDPERTVSLPRINEPTTDEHVPFREQNPVEARNPFREQLGESRRTVDRASLHEVASKQWSPRGVARVGVCNEAIKARHKTTGGDSGGPWFGGMEIAYGVHSGYCGSPDNMAFTRVYMFDARGWRVSAQ